MILPLRIILVDQRPAGNQSNGANTIAIVQGVNLSLVRTMITHPDGRTVEQRVVWVGYTNSVNLRDIDPQILFNYIQGEFLQYMNVVYYQK